MAYPKTTPLPDGDPPCWPDGPGGVAVPPAAIQMQVPELLGQYARLGPQSERGRADIFVQQNTDSEFWPILKNPGNENIPRDG